jgi:predicted transcriptional regulator of viral defense system
VDEVFHTAERVDALIARLAAQQHGVVTRAQLIRLGLSSRQIDHRLATGRLHRLHRGVYLVGHSVPPPFALEMAAVLAFDGRAVLSHRSAAKLWELLAYEGEVEVTVVGRGIRQRPGMRVHVVRSLDRRDVTKRRGIPITTPPRTVLDLAETASEREVDRAFEEGRISRRVSRRQLEQLLARSPGRHGAAVIGGLLESENEPRRTKSELEQMMLAIVDSANLPHPEVNAMVGPHEVDLVWRREKVAVEVDSWRFHRTRHACAIGSATPISTPWASGRCASPGDK